MVLVRSRGGGSGGIATVADVLPIHRLRDEFQTVCFLSTNVDQNHTPQQTPMKPPVRYIAYYRVSTARQGRSGLGLDAQRAAVRSFLAAHPGDLADEFTEVETGKHA